MTSLRISTIHLENFKSWYGLHSIYLDPEKFTAIVGANGSGKSNIIDALLFVFGWRAKQLRQTKATDLIHYSQEQPDFARVQIDFVDGQESFSIARVIRRSGQSYYEINGARATLEQTTAILLEHGLDIGHNRFLILQGEVESISMMKPAGDDLLGSMTQQQLQNLQHLRNICDEMQIEFDPTRYDEVLALVAQNCKTKEQQEKLGKIVSIDSLSQQETGLLEFIEQIVGTQDKIPGLARQSALVEFILQVKNEIRLQLQQALQYRDQLGDAKDEAVGRLRKQANEIVGQMSGLMYEASRDRVEIQLKGIESAELQQTIQSLQTGEILAKQREMEGAQAEIVSLQVRMAEEDARLCAEQSTLKERLLEQRLQQERFSHTQADADSCQIQQEAGRRELGELQAAFGALPERKQVLEESLACVQEAVQGKEAELQRVQTQSDKTSQEAQEAKQRLLQMEKELAPVAKRRAEIQAGLELAGTHTSQRLRELARVSAELGGDLVRIVGRLGFRNVSGSKVAAQLRVLDEQERRLNAGELRTKLKSAQKQLDTEKAAAMEAELALKESRASASDSSRQSKITAALAQQVRKNLLRGVHGRLGSLGAIDADLNLAAVAAFQGQLDFIVCDNMEAIQGAIQFLKEKQLGVASFIDLEQVGRRFRQYQSRVDRRALEQQNACLFLDLLQCEDQYRPAFWHVMGETVVCETPEGAQVLNRGQNGREKLRCVTRDGEVYERTGVLTGGGSRELLGRFQGFTGEAVGVQARKQEELQKGLQKALQSMEKLAAEIAEIEKKLAAAEEIRVQREALVEQLEGARFETLQNMQLIGKLVGNVKALDQNDTLAFCGGSVSGVILQELRVLEEAIAAYTARQQQQQQVDAIMDPAEVIPGIAELVTYYKQIGITTPEELTAVVSKMDCLDALESEDSPVANMLHFRAPLTAVFKLDAQKADREELGRVLEQEKALQAQIKQIQARLNADSGMRLYAQLRREISELSQQKAQIQAQIESLRVEEARFLPSVERLEAQIREAAARLGELQRLAAEIAQQLEQIAQSIRGQQQIIQQLGVLKQQVQTAIEHATKVRRNAELELQQLSGQLTKLQAILQQNQQLIGKNTAEIAENEAQIAIGVGLLHELAAQLSKAQETLNFQAPLYQNHENTEELEAYDQFVLGNFEAPGRKQSHKAGFKDVNLLAQFVGEFRVLQDYEGRVQQLLQQQEVFSQVQKDYEEQLALFTKERDARASLFMESFTEINSRLREIYRVFSMGGDATLELVDAFDPFQGLNYSVMPPKKAWRPIQNLSGGEKTLSSLSLIFALHQFKKNFIYVVDEIDAALDFRNVSLVANYLKEQARECQFVIISLRNNTFEVADALIGVYKVNNISRTVSLDLSDV